MARSQSQAAEAVRRVRASVRTEVEPTEVLFGLPAARLGRLLPVREALRAQAAHDRTLLLKGLRLQRGGGREERRASAASLCEMWDRVSSTDGSLVLLLAQVRGGGSSSRPGRRIQLSQVRRANPSPLPQSQTDASLLCRWLPRTQARCAQAREWRVCSDQDSGRLGVRTPCRDAHRSRAGASLERARSPSQRQEIRQQGEAWTHEREEVSPVVLQPRALEGQERARDATRHSVVRLPLSRMSVSRARLPLLTGRIQTRSHRP